MKHNFSRPETGPGRNTEDPQLGSASSNINNPQDVDWGSGPVELPFAEPVPVTEHKLFFGLRRRDGTVVPEAEWKAFETANFPTCFPEGFTVLPGSGGWPSPKGPYLDEPSKVVFASVPVGQPLLDVTVAALALFWELETKQQCVLWIRSAALSTKL